MKYDGIIFDLDGTLIDTLGDIALHANKVLTALGFKGHEPEEYKLMIGMGMRNLVIKALPEEAALDEALVETCVQGLIASYREKPVVVSKPYPEVESLLGELARRNIPAAVLSNKEDSLTLKVMSSLLPSFRFSYIQGEKKGIPKKPDPACALIAAERMGLGPERIVFLGDSGSDMETALNAGMVPLAALWGFRPREELEDAGAAEFCGTPREVLKYF